MISKLDEREARGLFEMSIYQMSELKMSYENLFGVKTSVTLFISFENSPKEVIKAHVINARITWESNTCN